MKKSRKARIFPLVILIVFFVLICMVPYFKYLFRTVILPTKSEPFTLTLVEHSGYDFKRITVKHYVDDVQYNTYLLELKEEIYSLCYHKYSLPRIEEGWVEISADIDDTNSGWHKRTLIAKYDANELRENGALIYSKKQDDIDYIYFIVGNERLIYKNPLGTMEWEITKDAPKLERRVSLGDGGYITSQLDKGISKINKWETIPKSEVR